MIMYPGLRNGCLKNIFRFNVRMTRLLYFISREFLFTDKRNRCFSRRQITGVGVPIETLRVFFIRLLFFIAKVRLMTQPKVRSYHRLWKLAAVLKETNRE